MLSIYGNKTLTNPPFGARKIPDIASNHLLTFDAADLIGSFANGEAVNNWVAVGDADLSMRTLASTTSVPGDGSSMNFPVFSLNTGPNNLPAVVFDGTSRLVNFGAYTEYAQPITMSLVFKYDINNPPSGSRIVGGIIIGKFNSIQPSSTSGQLLINGGVQVSTGIRTPGWIHAIIVFDGINSKWKFNSGGIVGGNVGANPQRGFTLGASNGILDAASAPGARMALCELSMYSRAFNDDDINELYEAKKEKYGF